MNTSLILSIVAGILMTLCTAAVAVACVAVAIALIWGACWLADWFGGKKS